MTSTRQNGPRALTSSTPPPAYNACFTSAETTTTTTTSSTTPSTEAEPEAAASSTPPPTPSTAPTPPRSPPPYNAKFRSTTPPPAYATINFITTTTTTTTTSSSSSSRGHSHNPRSRSSRRNRPITALEYFYCRFPGRSGAWLPFGSTYETDSDSDSDSDSDLESQRGESGERRRLIRPARLIQPSPLSIRAIRRQWIINEMATMSWEDVKECARRVMMGIMFTIFTIVIVGYFVAAGYFLFAALSDLFRNP